MTAVSRREPVLVDVLLAGTRISGLTLLIEERRRLVDVLNGPETVLELSDAAIAGHDTTLSLVQVRKSAIIAAIPHETEEQLRMRAVLSAGIASQRRLPVKVVLVVPPLLLEGTAYLPFGTGAATSLDLAQLQRFFPLTDVTLVTAKGERISANVTVVNRDAVAAIARAGE